MNRRSFLQTAGAFLALFRAGGRSLSAASYDAFEKSIGELQADMAAGRTSAAGLVRFYQDRIAAYDQAGPRLNAVIFLNPQALADARALDEERKKRGPRGPLHGIPVLLKDNYETRDMPTTGGSLALAGAVPARDAFQVRRLREAGAVMLGKVNLHELALGLTTISSWPDARTVRSDARARWIERWIRRRGRRQIRRVHDGHRHGRIDSHPQLAQQHCRPAAVGRPLEPLGNHPVRAHAGYRRADGANGIGHRDRPRRHRG